MQIMFSYEEDFKKLLHRLKTKYSVEFFNIEGIGEQLDSAAFSKKLFLSNLTQENSIDANANVSDLTPAVYLTEMPKPILKLNSYYILWKELRQLYNTQIAEQIIEKQLCGDIYINDMHGISAKMAYCFNFSAMDILVKGLPFVSKIKTTQPKHLLAYKSLVEQFITYASNSILGATGMADMLLVLSWYAEKIVETKSDSHFNFSSKADCWKYIEENIVSMIYTFNQPFRSAIQSPFVNISVYDTPFLEDLKGKYKFPDGRGLNLDVVKKVQEIYLKVMNKELERTPITFPVTTACLAVDKEGNIIDKDFLTLIASENLEYGFINIYCGDSSTLSSCCFSGSQEVLTKSSNGIKLSSFEEIANSGWRENRRNFTVFHNGSWKSAKIVKLNYKDNLFKIKTSNNKEIIVTKNHINLTFDGDKKTNILTEEDYLAFNTRKLEAYPEKDDKLTYEQGYIIGLYLGDGSKYKRKNNNACEVTFSLNENNRKDLITIRKGLNHFKVKEKIRTYKQNNTMLTKINSKKLFDIITNYVYGDYSYEKELNINVLTQSVAFRTGICDGWYDSDGGNSNRIYSVSKKLINAGEALFTSLGKNTIINKSDRTGKDKVIIRGRKFNRNYPLYCLRWYSMNNKRSISNVYKVKNNTEYFKIKSIEKLDKKEQEVYCFEMKHEPYFTLPNGIITHNCRLRSKTNSKYFNSFGVARTKIGSVGVVTINLPRLAFRNKGNIDAFFVDLKKEVECSARVNHAKRHIIKKGILRGHLPLYSLGFMDIAQQYSTTGLTGLYESCEIMGMSIKQVEGKEFVNNILEVVNSECDRFQDKFESPHNVEQVPGESLSVKLASKDTLIGLNKEYKLYSNQFIPLTKNGNILDRIILQGEFDSKLSGGGILHINSQEKVSSLEKMKKLIEFSASKRVVYFAINYNLQRCEKDHLSVGLMENCPICKSKITDNFTRVVGFLVNVKNFNKVRKEVDYPERKWFNI